MIASCLELRSHSAEVVTRPAVSYVNSKGMKYMDHSFQEVAWCSRPDLGTDGYHRENDANHRSDNKGVVRGPVVGASLSASTLKAIASN